MITKSTRRRQLTNVVHGPKRPVGRPPKKSQPQQQQKAEEVLLQPSESNSLVEQMPNMIVDQQQIHFKRHPQDLQDINVDMLTYQMRSVLPSLSHSLTLSNQFFQHDDIYSSFPNEDFIENTTLPSINSFMNKKYLL